MDFGDEFGDAPISLSSSDDEEEEDALNQATFDDALEGTRERLLK